MSDVSMAVAGDGFTLDVLGKPGASGEPCLALMHQYIEGWYSTPDLKVESHSRQTGSGNFQTTDDRVLYESRTVTAHVLAYGRNRDEVVAWAGRLHRAVGGIVTATVTDGGVSTWVRGYCQINFDAEHYEDAMPGTLTVVCDDPRRYGEMHCRSLSAGGTHSGALQWSGDAPRGLVWPTSFGDSGGTAPSLTVAENAGTATAYPVVEAVGFPSGFELVSDGPSGQSVLRYGASVGSAPLVLDCLSRTASVGGVDVTRDLTARGFPSIPPSGPVRLSVVAPGTGTVSVSWHDTYI